jgi:hypothetical protein
MKISVLWVVAPSTCKQSGHSPCSWRSRWAPLIRLTISTRHRGAKTQKAVTQTASSRLHTRSAQRRCGVQLCPIWHHTQCGARAHFTLRRVLGKISKRCLKRHCDDRPETRCKCPESNHPRCETNYRVAFLHYQMPRRYRHRSSLRYKMNTIRTRAWTVAIVTTSSN